MAKAPCFFRSFCEKSKKIKRNCHQKRSRSRENKQVWNNPIHTDTVVPNPNPLSLSISSNREATHIIQNDPNEEETDDLDYLRTVEIKGDNALVHWWYYPDSHNTWLPISEVQVGGRERGGGREEGEESWESNIL